MLKDGSYGNFFAPTLFMQDLCAICTDFIVSELWTTNFLSYQVRRPLVILQELSCFTGLQQVFIFQVFAESQDYGIHGERVRNACWGYLCQSGMEELREVQHNPFILVGINMQ